MLIAQLSDTHIREPGTLAYRRVDTAPYLARAVAHVMQLDPRPDIAIVTGDLVDMGSAAEYRHLRELLAPLTMPVHVIPGNHDDRETLAAAFSDHAYLPRTGGFLHYVVNDHDVRLVAVDTIVPGAHHGLMCEHRLAWLDDRLAEQPDRPTVIVMHHPPFLTGIDYMDRYKLENAAAMRAVVARHGNVEAVLAGHLHRPISMRWAGTVAVTSPSPAHQVALDLRPSGPSGFTLEPPACLLHLWKPGQGLVTHTSYIGDYEGPYPFRQAAHDGSGAAGGRM
jgi:3',5'-cyclic AMP phosphodiesterase CpdA